MEKETFPCTSEGLSRAQVFLETWCPEPKPAIILDEIVSNIVRCSGAESFSIALDHAEDGLRLVFVDNGRPFDPTKDAADPDITAGAEMRDIGGLGIFMVKKMSKSVAYRRDKGANELTVVL